MAAGASAAPAISVFSGFVTSRVVNMVGPWTAASMVLALELERSKGAEKGTESDQLRSLDHVESSGRCDSTENLSQV